MNDQHTAKAFDTDLQDIARMVAEMGGLAEKQIADAVSALAKRDRGGIRFGVLGTLGKEAMIYTSGGATTFADPAESAKEVVKIQIGRAHV